jgi:hypothetical protein
VLLRELVEGAVGVARERSGGKEKGGSGAVVISPDDV